MPRVAGNVMYIIYCTSFILINYWFHICWLSTLTVFNLSNTTLHYVFAFFRNELSNLFTKIICSQPQIYSHNHLFPASIRYLDPQQQAILWMTSKSTTLRIGNLQVIHKPNRVWETGKANKMCSGATDTLWNAT